MEIDMIGVLQLQLSINLSRRRKGCVLDEGSSQAGAVCSLAHGPPSIVANLELGSG